MRFLLFIILMPGLLVPTLDASELAFSEQQIANLGIELIQPRVTRVRLGGHLPGRVIVPPRQAYVISAPQGGLVTQVSVAAGDSVKAGQLLAELQSPELITLQGDYLKTLARYKLAQENYRRDKQLFEEGIIAERRYLDTQSQLTEARAALNAQKQVLSLAGMEAAALRELTNQRRLSGGLKIHAPAAGVVLASNVASGQRVNGMDMLFKIANLEVLWLEIRAPLDRLDDLTSGTPIEVDQTPARGKITLIGREVDPDNQTVLVRGVIDQQAQALRVGQFVEVQVNTPTDQPYVRVPQGALARSDKEVVVFIRTSTGFRIQPVKIISEHDTDAVIGGDLPSEARLAGSGLSALKSAWLSGAESGD